METGARTPEELETMFEDAFLLQDAKALLSLFDDGAILITGNGREARGPHNIARATQQMWDQDRTYIAAPRNVLQARDTALLLAGLSTNVVRRDGHGVWRYLISLLIDPIERAASTNLNGGTK